MIYNITSMCHCIKMSNKMFSKKINDPLIKPPHVNVYTNSVVATVKAPYMYSFDEKLCQL